MRHLIVWDGKQTDFLDVSVVRAGAAGQWMLNMSQASQHAGQLVLWQGGRRPEDEWLRVARAMVSTGVERPCVFDILTGQLCAHDRSWELNISESVLNMMCQMGILISEQTEFFEDSYRLHPRAYGFQPSFDVHQGEAALQAGCCSLQCRSAIIRH